MNTRLDLSNERIAAGLPKPGKHNVTLNDLRIIDRSEEGVVWGAFQFEIEGSGDVELFTATAADPKVPDDVTDQKEIAMRRRNAQTARQGIVIIRQLCEIAELDPDGFNSYEDLHCLMEIM